MGSLVGRQERHTLTGGLTQRGHTQIPILDLEFGLQLPLPHALAPQSGPEAEISGARSLRNGAKFGYFLVSKVLYG